MIERFSPHPREYQQPTEHLSTAEIAVIRGRATVRRQEMIFREHIQAVAPESAEQLRLLASHQYVPPFLQRERTAAELKLELAQLEHTAKEADDPDIACFRYLAAAQLAYAAGEEYANYLQEARAVLAHLGEGVAALRARASLLGFEQRLAKQTTLPAVDAVAAAVMGGHAGVLREYALAVPAEDRDAFLSHFPETKGKKGLSRTEVSAIMDRLLSDLYVHGTVGEHEQEEARAILDRSEQAARAAIAEPTAAETRRMLTLLSHTIAQLPDEENTFMLRDLAELTRAKVRGDKTATEARMRMGIAIAREAFAADRTNGSIIMKKMLGNPELPQAVWTEFVQALIQTGDVSRHVSRWIPKDEVVVRALFAEYPNEVNTIADTLANKRFTDVDLTIHRDVVFSALKDLGTVTPIIFDRYRKADPSERDILVQQLRTLKPAFFRNQDIRSILPKKDQEILAEMVNMSYRPVGMSFKQVQHYLRDIDDYTEHLESYTFPEDGYTLELAGAREYRLREQATLDRRTIETVRNLFMERPKEWYAERIAMQKKQKDTATDVRPVPDVNPTEAYVWSVRDLLLRFAKGGSECSTEELVTTLSLMHGDDRVVRFSKTYSQVGEQNGYAFFTAAKELLGHDIQEYYPKRLENFLSAQPAVAERLIKELQKPHRQADLKKKLGRDAGTVSFDINTPTDAAQLITKWIDTKVLTTIRTAVQRGANSFESTSGLSGRVGDVRAFFSKNAASFFAKAAAGICTSEDRELFEREDHFHINVVEDEAQVLGNIQAYVIPEKNGSKSLVLRGFNPTTDALKRIEPGQFVEEILRITTEFVRANAFEGLYITEGLGGWHALSNREQINKYIQPKYCKPDRARPYRLTITGGGQRVNTLFQIQQGKNSK